MRHRRWIGIAIVACLAAAASVQADEPKAGDAALGTQPYDRFEPNDVCVDCHVDITRQHEQSMMSQCFVHHWDEIEYFELAKPHAEKVAKVAGIKAGCNGCHAPLAFLAGDIPPKRPAENTRANESISCDLCHTISGFEGDVPYNFNYIVKPGNAKMGVREGTESPHHEIEVNPFLMTAEFCGTCHNEKDPWDQWVKATHLEWKEGPYAKAGIVCQDCHMGKTAGNSAPEFGGQDHPDVRWHLFHGAHDPGKLAGAVEVRIHPDEREVKPGGEVVLTATVMNAKAGHMIPSGSAEERVVWLHVEAEDASGRRYHLPVDAKGFEGEEMTIASATALAYQDLGEIQDLKDFKGLPRDGQVPPGDRIYRLPYLDPKGRMTIAQWNTASFGPDYRLAPLEGRNETFTWKLPAGVAPGELTVTATVWYSRLVDSVGRHLRVPEEEWKPEMMGRHATVLEVKKG
jgi:nitrate/TMAO reductase-like tetraheme cytochrome c subunit